MNELDALRDSISRLTQRGVGMPIAGMFYWLAMAVVGALLPQKQACLVFFYATGAVFPIGFLITKALGGNLIIKGHPLTGLGGLLNAVQFFYWPVLIAVALTAPHLVPFTMGVLFCSHFLAYGWFYRSRGYTTLGIAGPVVTIGLQLAAPSQAFVMIPLALAAVYAVAIAMVLGENGRVDDQRKSLRDVRSTAAAILP